MTGIGLLYKALVMQKIIDLKNDTIKGVLMSSGFSWNPVTHKVYADITASELPTANGYTAGGLTLTGATVTEDDASGFSKVTWNNASWVVSTANLLSAGMFLVDTTVAAPVVSPIIAYIDFEGTVTTLVGGTLLVSNLGVYQV